METAKALFGLRPVAALFLVFLPSVCHAQGTSLGPVEVSVLKYLLELPDQDVAVRYTPGALDRAARLQDHLRRLYGDLLSWTGETEPQVFLVLSPQEWESLGIQERYGFPVQVDERVLAVPAWGTEETVKMWRELMGSSLPSVGGFSARGTPEEVASIALADAFLQLQICRAAARRLTLAGGEDGLWLNDVLAHLLSLSSDRLAAFPPALRLASALAGSGEGSPPGLPQDYGAGLDGPTWVAFHAHFSRAAESMWEEKGKKAVRRALKLRRRKELPLAFSDLVKDFPGLEKWRRDWS